MSVLPLALTWLRLAALSHVRGEERAFAERWTYILGVMFYSITYVIFCDALNASNAQTHGAKLTCESLKKAEEEEEEATTISWLIPLGTLFEGGLCPPAGMHC